MGCFLGFPTLDLRPKIARQGSSFFVALPPEFVVDERHGLGQDLLCAWVRVVLLIDARVAVGQQRCSVLCRDTFFAEPGIDGVTQRVGRDVRREDKLLGLAVGRLALDVLAGEPGALNGGSPASEQALRWTLSPETIERLAAGNRAKLIDQDFAGRGAAYDHAVADPEAFWRGEIIPEPNDWKTFKGRLYSYWVYLCDDPETPLETGIAYALHARREVRLAEVKQALCLGKTDLLGSEADALLTFYEHEGSDRLRLVRRLMEVEIAAQTSLLTEQSANFPPAGTECEDDSENPLLSAAAQSWLEEKKSLGLTARRIEDCEGAVALFTEVIGDRPIANYTKGNVRDFKDVLRALPPNRSKIRATRNLRCVRLYGVSNDCVYCIPQSFYPKAGSEWIGPGGTERCSEVSSWRRRHSHCDIHRSGKRQEQFTTAIGSGRIIVTDSKAQKVFAGQPIRYPVEENGRHVPASTKQ
jgi:hypothetical protein